jgi:hypothetical protein
MWKTYGKVKPTPAPWAAHQCEFHHTNHTSSSTVQFTVFSSNSSSSFLFLVKELSVISASLLLKVLLLPQETRPKTKTKQNQKNHKNYKFTSCCMHPLIVYGDDKFILNSLQVHVNHSQTRKVCLCLLI